MKIILVVVQAFVETDKYNAYVEDTEVCPIVSFQVRYLHSIVLV